MATIITNQSSNLKIEFKNKIEYIPKPFGISFGKNTDRIYVHSDGKSGLNKTQVGIRIDFDSVTSPVAADAETLADTIQAYNHDSQNGTFTNDDLTAGVLTITHNLGSTSIAVVIRDPDGQETIPTNTVVDSDSLTVDFGGAIGAGTYTWFVYVK